MAREEYFFVYINMSTGGFVSLNSSNYMGHIYKENTKEARVAMTEYLF